MGLFNRKVTGLVEAGIGLISRGKHNFSGSDKVDGDEQNVSLQQQYDNAYLNFPLVHGVINTTAEQVVQDFWFEGPDKDKNKERADKLNLGYQFEVIVKHLLKNGNMWIEMPSEDEMKFIDPKTMKIWRKSNGDIIGHSQFLDGKKVALWGTTGDLDKNQTYKSKADIEDIVVFRFNLLAGDKYGTSLIHSVLPLLKNKESMEGSTKTIMDRYAAPIIHAKVGDEMHLPSDTDLTAIKNDMKDIYSDTEYVTNHLTEFKVLGFEGKAMDISSPLKQVDQNILTGLQFPIELTSLEVSSNKAEAEVKLRSWGRHIKAIQRILKIEFEDKIMYGKWSQSSENKIIFGDAEEREQEIKMDQIRGLVTDGIITPQKGNDLLPPKFEEKLPEPVEMDMNPATGAATKAQGQDQKPFQKGADKIKQNPTDPTLKQKAPGQRRNKTDRKVPVK